MSVAIIFYAGLIYAEPATHAELQLTRMSCGPEIYNGAYLYYKKAYEGRHWYSMDGCPRLLEDIPKELKMMILLLS